MIKNRIKRCDFIVGPATFVTDLCAYFHARPRKAKNLPFYSSMFIIAVSEKYNSSNFDHPLTETVFPMDYEIASFSSDELTELYQKINSELNRRILNGSSSHEQQDKINTFNQISKELAIRRIASGRQPPNDDKHHRNKI